jgi:hypothetical protein
MGAKQAIRISTKPRNYQGIKKGRPKGLYDTNILCALCDTTILKDYDDFGKEILFNQNLISLNDGNFITENDVDTIFTKINIDAFRFRLFIASIFWRASISKKEFCSAINLNPPNEHKLKQLLLSKDPQFDFGFGVFVLSLAPQLPKDYLFNFIKVDRKGSFFYAFCAGGIIFCFAPDKNLLLNHLRKYLIQDKTSVHILVINSVSDSYKILEDFINMKFL